MRIAINCRSFLKKQSTGIGRYAYHLIDSLTKIDHQNEYTLYVQKKVFDQKRRVPRFDAANFHVKVDRFNKGPGKILKSVDIYHSPSPDDIDVNGAKVVATVHDLIYKTYPEAHTKETIDLTDRYIKNIVQRADKIICISKTTMDDLLRYFDVAREKVCLIYQGVDKSIFYPIKEDEKATAQKLLKNKGVLGEYIFFVGTIEPRKNLANLLKAFADLKKNKKFSGQLVIAGMKGWMSEGIPEEIEELGIKDDTVFLGFLTNEELRLFYNCAKVFVFPSFYEGFGFPILESFACGTPVITSNVSSCPEVAGDAALLIDPNSAQQIADAIIKINEDDNLRESLIEKGLKRTDEFSFENTAQKTLEVYREVYSRG